jgi:hypothetical protein
VSLMPLLLHISERGVIFMVVVLCESYLEAKLAFKRYLTFLFGNDPSCIWEVYEQALCIELDEDL